MSTANSRLILGLWRIGQWGKSPEQVACLVSACLDLDRHIASYSTSREHIVASVKGSLTCLGVEKFDLLLIHRPIS
jgi:predicted oxidoreductase